MVYSGEIVYDLSTDAENSASKVMVAPGLNGRILTSKVGTVESVGFVNMNAIERGEASQQFNNFGGQDRLWIGPEAEQFGFYFEPGGDFDREKWRVPEPLNEGAMKVISADGQKITLQREMELTNYQSVQFKMRVDREVGVISSMQLNEEIGVSLPEEVEFTASYSLNTLTNTGDKAWSSATGLPTIWILGQYNGGANTVILAPFKTGEESELGPILFDDYFGKVREKTPERLKVSDACAVFKADAKMEGKFGISPRRTTGFAGSYDPDQNLLIICKFDFDPEARFYPTYTWLENNPKPYSGDVFQTYNADSLSNSENSFYELESASPGRELNPGESFNHRHAVFTFQGSETALSAIAEKVLKIKLSEALELLE